MAASHWALSYATAATALLPFNACVQTERVNHRSTTRRLATANTWGAYSLYLLVLLPRAISPWSAVKPRTRANPSIERTWKSWLPFHTILTAWMRWRIKNRLTQERSHGNTYAVGKPQIFLFGTINRKPNPELQPHINFLNYQQNLSTWKQQKLP